MSTVISPPAAVTPPATPLPNSLAAAFAAAWAWLVAAALVIWINRVALIVWTAIAALPVTTGYMVWLGKFSLLSWAALALLTWLGCEPLAASVIAALRRIGARANAAKVVAWLVATGAIWCSFYRWATGQDGLFLLMVVVTMTVTIFLTGLIFRPIK